MPLQPTLGVGLVFTPKLMPLLRQPGLVQVIEIEPQTLWQIARQGNAAKSATDPHRKHNSQYFVNEARLNELIALPQPKIMHSVGLPVGGSCPHEAAQIPLLQGMIRQLRPHWFSDHLSFNSFRQHDLQKHDSWVHTGFFLPPLQHPDSVRNAAEQLIDLSVNLDCPILFETGVNYFQPRHAEYTDGYFFRKVAEQADCGILLDLHNLWVNEKNGRQSVREALACMPLDRVIEVHLAGGSTFNGYWLDAHHGATHPELIELTKQVLPLLPNLRALIFEILDEHVEHLGLDGVQQQLEMLHQLWHTRSKSTTQALKTTSGTTHYHVPERPAYTQSIEQWEHALGSLVSEQPIENKLARQLLEDPATHLYRKLAFDARSGAIARALEHTLTLLFKIIGPTAVHTLVSNYMRHHRPQLFVSAEADQFACYLKQQRHAIPYLADVLNFEHALIRAALYQESTRLDFSYDPTELFDALAAGTLPDHPKKMASSMVIEAVV